MNQPFTASEVRRQASTFGRGRVNNMLRAFADLLETREKAVPVAIVKDSDALYTGFLSWTDESVPPETKLYTHPAPADAERLAEALRELVVACEEHDAMVSRIIGHPAGWNAQYLNSAREALAAHSAQAQPPAASVPDIETMVNRFLSWRLPKPWNPDNGISYTRPNYAHEPAEHDWPTGTNLFDAHQAREMIEYMLAAQESPNG